MKRVYNNIEELIGNTPILKLDKLTNAYGISADIYAKLEYLNPTGSAKDRAALGMIIAAEKEEKLKPGGTIIEPTSGNTGIAIAAIASARGYRAIIVMPDTMSEERRALMRAFGAELVLTPGAEGMTGAIQKAEELAAGIPGSFIPGQFENPANALAHSQTTGPEIWADTDGQVDVFVACVGTGGTITGTARYLKEKNPALHVVAVEPASSPLLSKGYAGAHGIQGIGANFVPEVLDKTVYDEIITVTDEDAFAAARMMGSTEGVLVGISSGAALVAAMELAAREENAGKTVVAVLTDSGERYISSGLY